MNVKEQRSLGLWMPHRLPELESRLFLVVTLNLVLTRG